MEVFDKEDELRGDDLPVRPPPPSPSFPPTLPSLVPFAREQKKR